MIIGDYDVQDERDVVDVLQNSGFDYFDASNLVSLIAEAAVSRYEEDYLGDWHIALDEYERSCDGISAEINDLLQEVENLEGPSKKNQTRKDIAERLKVIADNIESINGCFL